MLYWAGNRQRRRYEAADTGPERFLHRLQEELPKVTALTTPEPYAEIRRTGSSRYRGYERQSFAGCKQGGTVEYNDVSHP